MFHIKKLNYNSKLEFINFSLQWYVSKIDSEYLSRLEII